MWWLLLLLIFLYYFFIRPAWRVWSAVNQARKQAREMNDAFRRAAGIDPEEERRQENKRKKTSRKGGWSEPQPKKKKIDPEVGEYIKFQEVTVEQTTVDSEDGQTTTASTTVSEQQITDVSWEDLPRLDDK